MSMDKKQFCFIICTNNRQYLDECLIYISLLEIPKGYTIDILTIEGASSMASGYNAAMNASNAKYKIYLHHDTMILNRYFLVNILKIFKSDDDIGMIGMGGNVHLDDDALISFDLSRYVGYNMNFTLQKYVSNKIKDNDYIYDVEAIDGFIMATQYDLKWREDLFDGWDYYDISQSMEFHRQNYRVIVPEQKEVEWCFHADDLTSTLYNFEKYRKIFLSEYKKDIETYDIERKAERVYREGQETIEERIEQYKMISKLSNVIQEDTATVLGKAEEFIKSKNISGIDMFLGYMEKEIRSNVIYRMSVDIRRVHHVFISVINEYDNGLHIFLEDVNDLKELRYKYIKTQMLLRRIEMGLPDHLQQEAFEFATASTISPYFLSVILNNEYSCFSQRKRILTEVCNKYIEIGDINRAKIAIGLFDK